MARDIDIIGLPGLQAACKARAVALGLAARAAVSLETRAVASDARSNAPRDTGELVDGIESRTSGLSGEVESTAPHSGHVEFGTSDTPAQPFMGPAASKSRGRFIGRVTAGVRKAAS